MKTTCSSTKYIIYKSDEFYVTVIGNIVPEKTMDITPGETVDEKADSLEQLVNFLSGIVEMDLTHIDGRRIIYERDSVSAKHLLELILELILVLNQEPGISQLDDSQQLDSINGSRPIGEHSPADLQHINDIKDQSSEDYRVNLSCPEKYIEVNPDLKMKQNLSYNDILGCNLVSYSDQQQEEGELQENQEHYKKIKENMSLEDIGQYLAGDKEGEEQMHQQNTDNLEYEEESKSINISRISEVSKSKENSEPHSHQKFGKLNNNMKYEHEVNMSDPSKQTKSLGQQQSHDYTSYNTSFNNNAAYQHRMVSHQDSYGPSKLSSIESKQNAEGGLSNQEVYKQPGNLDTTDNQNNTEDGRPELNQRRQINPNRESEKSSNMYIKNSQTSSNKSIRHNDKKALEDSSVGYVSDNKSVKQEERKMLKKNKSQKQLLNNKTNKSYNKSRSNISMSSVNSVNQSKVKDGDRSNQQVDNSDIFIEELPINEEHLKYEIVKEFRKIYGNKLDKIFLRDNFNKSSDILEIIMRNIKLARNKMLKLGVSNQKDPDDLIVSMI